jgi:capsule biosynthesis phosphatase
MIVVVLCGGLGTRLEDYSFPKPLNMIYGKPSIVYCLQNLPDIVTTIHFIVAPHLVKYNFAEIVTNEFKTKQCIFHYLPYCTRGAIESAFIGTTNIKGISDDENIVFLDNDVLYKFPENMFSDKPSAFIGYSMDTTNSNNFSYIKLDNSNHVIEFKEKRRISDMFCCGVYGFSSMQQFRQLAYIRLMNEYTSELYLSLLFQDMIEQNTTISGVFFNDTIKHIGTLKELKESWPHISCKKMRVCFDLDNTLVTYPTIPNDYTSVKPIDAMIRLVKQLHSDGHTIIIHTARRMKTHNNNVGAVIKDIGITTFQTLTDFEIPYDELIFGKPIADMYFDDRAINPYRNDLCSMGYIYPDDKETPLNTLQPNKYNCIQVIDNSVVKTGPSIFIQGEIYYYNNLPKCSVLKSYFPTYNSSYTENDSGMLNIEYLKGIPVFTLYKNGLLTPKNISGFIEFLDLLHNYNNQDIIISGDQVSSNYTDKLINRFKLVEDYPFEDAEVVQELCLSRIHKYISDGKINIVNYIHGDLWFSNMLIDFKGNIKVFDMRGKIYNTYTTNGDRLYDYAKLYQSILGYDCVLNNDTLPSNYQSLREYFEKEITKHLICLEDLRTITFSLVIGTFHSIEKADVKQRVWIWIKENFV